MKYLLSIFVVLSFVSCTDQKTINAKYYHAITEILFWCESAAIAQIEFDTDVSDMHESVRKYYKNFVGRRFDSYTNLDNLPEGTLECLASPEHRREMVTKLQKKVNVLNDGTEWTAVYQSFESLEIYENQTKEMLRDVMSNYPKPDWLPIIDLGEDPLGILYNNPADVDEDPLKVLN